MKNRDNNILQRLDWFTILLYLLLVTIGFFSICGACYEFGSPTIIPPQSRPYSQLIWIALSTILIFIILMTEKSFFETTAYLMYGGVILLLIATIFLAKDIKGSHSWLVLGPIRLQPAEFAKFATALALAKFMSTYDFKLRNIKNFFISLAIIFVPMISIILQNETGSALVYFAFFFMLYREGMTGYILGLGLSAVVYFVVGMKFSDTLSVITPIGELAVEGIILFLCFTMVYILRKDKKTILIGLIFSALSFGIGGLVSQFIAVDFSLISLGLICLMIIYFIILSLHKWVIQYALIAVFAIGSVAFLFSVHYVFNEILEPHQQTRILVSLGMKEDPNGAGYNVNQSKIAIGSGGILGKGFLNGTQTKLNYVPEQATDFIFCTVGEEQGFIGSSIVILLFSCFIIRLIILAERQDRAFSRIYGYCVASIFLFHLIINIGMVTGLTPVIGIPLPFFSYGGSSLWGFTLLLFIFIRLDASRKF